MSNPSQPTPGEGQVQPQVASVPPPIPRGMPVAHATHPAGPVELGYVTPAAVGARRPGIVTALGVLSIVFACLQGLVAIASIFSAAAMIAMSAFTPATTTATSTFYSPYGPTTATAATTPATMPTPAQVAAMNNAVASLFADPSLLPIRIASLVLAVGSLLLAILLLVAGIQLMRNRRSGRPLHKWWAILKVVVETIGAVIAGIATAQLMNAMNVTMALTPPPGSSGVNFHNTYVVVAIVQSGITWLFSVAYPIAVLIVITRRSAREWFATVDQG